MVTWTGVVVLQAGLSKFFVFEGLLTNKTFESLMAWADRKLCTCCGGKTLFSWSVVSI